MPSGSPLQRISCWMTGTFTWNSLLDGKMELGLSENAVDSNWSPWKNEIYMPVVFTCFHLLQLKVSQVSPIIFGQTLDFMTPGRVRTCRDWGLCHDHRDQPWIDCHEAAECCSLATQSCAFGDGQIGYMERHGVWLMIGFRGLAHSEGIFSCQDILRQYSDKYGCNRMTGIPPRLEIGWTENLDAVDWWLIVCYWLLATRVDIFGTQVGHEDQSWGTPGIRWLCMLHAED